MNKKLILYSYILLLLVIHPTFIFAQPAIGSGSSYSDMETNDQVVYLDKKCGTTGIIPSDVEVVCTSDSDGNTRYAVTLKSGNAVLNSKTDVQITLDGGSADVYSYSGAITIGAEGGILKGNNGNFVFGGEGSVQVIEGNIYFENIDLKEGSEIEGTLVSGEEISYDSKIGKLSTKEHIKIDELTYLPESDEFSYDAKSKRIDTNNQWVSIKKDSEIISRLNGVAEVKSEDEILLIASEENPTEFKNLKETKMRVSSDTCIGNKCDNKEISRIVYNGDFYVYAKNNNKIEINSKEGDYENFIIPQINDKSKVEIFLVKDGGNVFFSFSKDMPLMKGNANDLKTNIGHVFEDENQERWPWMIYNGENYEGESVGTIDDKPFGFLEDNDEKNLIILAIKSIDEFDSETALKASYALNHFGIDDIDIQKQILVRTTEFLIRKQTEDYSFFYFRYLIQKAGNDEITRELLEKAKIIDNPGWENDNMLKLYSDENFLLQTESLSNSRRWSIAVSTSRLITENWEKELTPENIDKATKDILQINEKLADKPIIDSQTNVIAVVATSADFSPESVKDFIIDCGVKDEKLKFFEGSKSSKEPFLDSISESKGKTTILFNNHGGPDNQFLTELSSYINYKELGEKLIKRGNLNEVVIIFDSCYSYEFKNKLYNYLNDKKEENGENFGTPSIITESNRVQKGSSLGEEGTVFLAYLDYVKPDGESLKYNDVYNVEDTYTFFPEDPSISVPWDGDLIEMGSSDNEFKELSDEIKDELVEPFTNLEDKNVIEISKLEPEMQENLASV